MPASDEFTYLFARLAEIVESFTVGLELERYSVYLMDYGALIGFRLASANSDKVEALIFQNRNASDEGRSGRCRLLLISASLSNLANCRIPTSALVSVQGARQSPRRAFHS